MLVEVKAYSSDPRQKILRACDQRLGSHRTIATLLASASPLSSSCSDSAGPPGTSTPASTRAADGPVDRWPEGLGCQSARRRDPTGGAAANAAGHTGSHLRSPRPTASYSYVSPG
jgi:hypothetical protein